MPLEIRRLEEGTLTGRSGAGWRAQQEIKCYRHATLMMEKHEGENLQRAVENLVQGQRREGQQKIVIRESTS